MPSSLTGSLIRGSPELPNHLNEKKEQLTLFQGFLHPSVTVQVKKKNIKKEKMIMDHSPENTGVQTECSSPSSPSKTSLPRPAEDKKPLGFQICYLHSTSSKGEKSCGSYADGHNMSLITPISIRQKSLTKLGWLDAKAWQVRASTSHPHAAPPAIRSIKWDLLSALVRS